MPGARKSRSRKNFSESNRQDIQMGIGYRESESEFQVLGPGVC